MSGEPRFCPTCGGALHAEIRHQQRRLICAACGNIHYRNPAVGVAVIVLDGDRVLLGRRARGPYAGKWCVPCGYVEWGEDVRHAARREFEEETSLQIELDDVAAVHSNFHDADKLTVGIWFYGRVIAGTAKASDDLDAVGYFALNELPPLAFPTDAQVLADLARRLATP